MNKLRILSGVACVSVFLATGAVAEILGVQPGTSANPKDNVPAEIQRNTDAPDPYFHCSPCSREDPPSDFSSKLTFQQRVASMP